MNSGEKLANEVLEALSYANDDVVEAARKAGQPEISMEERLAIIRDILETAYNAWEDIDNKVLGGRERVASRKEP